jgi:hypothetical protein
MDKGKPEGKMILKRCITLFLVEAQQEIKPQNMRS